MTKLFLHLGSRFAIVLMTIYKAISDFNPLKMKNEGFGVESANVRGFVNNSISIGNIF